MNWPKVRLQNVTSKVGSGSTPRGGDAVYQRSGIPLIRSMNVHFDGFRRDGLVFIDERHAEQLDHVGVQSEDVLFNITGASIGRVTTAPLEMAGARVNQHVCIIRPTEVLVPQFLSYYLATPEQQALISSIQVGGTRQAVTKAMLLNWQVPLPAHSEQRRTVELLEQADALRRYRTEADALSVRILPALFLKMFGDVRRNPKGLRRERLGNLIKVKSGELVAVRSLHFTDGYPVYGGNGVIGYHSEFMFDRPVVIIGRVGLYCGCVHYSREKCWVTDNALFVSEIDPALHEQYLVAALRIANLNQYAGRGGQPLISGNRIYPVEILVPPSDQQEKFFAVSEQAYKVIEQQEATSHDLQELFDTMLHRAFTGELTSRWREAHMKELLAEMEQQARYLNLNGETS